MKTRILFLLAVVSALVVCAGAGALIVPQHSIAGARLGMTKDQLVAKLGAPIRVRYHKSSPFGFAWREYFYPRVTVAVYDLNSGEKVINLTTKSRLERTKSGVGVGSTVAQLRAGLSGETCKKEYGIDHCWIGALGGRSGRQRLPPRERVA